VPDDDRGAAEVADQGKEVAGDIGARNGRPAHAGLAMPAQVRVYHPVASRGQLRSQEPVRLPAVADAVRQHDQRALPRHVVGDLATLDIQELSHFVLRS
jgi:hypothetical protein